MSGFVSSVKNAKWEPTGSPTIYKLINRLDKSDDQFDLVFTEKEVDSTKTEYARDIVIKLRGLKTPIHFLRSYKTKIWGRLRVYLSELRHILKIFQIIVAAKPEIIYVDRSNILVAAFIARFRRIPVVLRLLGVTPAMQELISKPALSHYLYRWAYRSPFSFVLCTKDGSPNKAWMLKALRSSVRREVWLNGVDEVSAEMNEDNKIHIIFLGRLDPLKRSQECIDALLSLPEAVIDKIQVSVIGTGILEKFLRKRVELTAFRKCISFLGAVPHIEVKNILSSGDVYISLNAQGNLSNANLEAMKAGLCFILPEADAATGIDLDTQDIIPTEAAVRIPLSKLIENLSNALLHLIGSPEEVKQRKKAMTEAGKSLVSWDDRIEKEYRLLSDIAVSKESPIENQHCPSSSGWRYYCSSSDCRDRKVRSERTSWDYYKCLQCGTIQIDEYTNVDDVYETEKIVKQYQEPRSLVRVAHKMLGHPLKKVYSTLDFSAKKILDVGCGNGQKLYDFYQRNAEKVCGVEFSQEKIDVAKRYMPEGDFFKGRLSESGFEKGSFDIVIADNVLEHIPDPDRFVRELFSYISNTGKLVLHIPYGRSFTIRFLKQKALNIWPPFHINLFTKKYFEMHFPDLNCSFKTKSYFYTLRQSFQRCGFPNLLSTCISFFLLPFSKEELIVTIENEK